MPLNVVDAGGHGQHLHILEMLPQDAPRYLLSDGRRGLVHHLGILLHTGSIIRGLLPSALRPGEAQNTRFLAKVTVLVARMTHAADVVLTARPQQPGLDLRLTPMIVREDATHQ